MGRIISVAAGEDFLEIIAKKWLKENADSLSMGKMQGIIFTPGRRAARSLQEAFLRVLEGKAALLPSIIPISNLEQDMLFSLPLEEKLPAAVNEVERLVILSQLIMEAPFLRPSFEYETGAIERAWPLARTLADLMDDAEHSYVHLKEKLPDAVEEEYAQHWEKVLEFLKIIKDIWPEWLKENRLLNPAERQVAMLEIQERIWRENEPNYPIWAIGFRDEEKDIQRFLKNISQLSSGVIILENVDMSIEEEIWDTLLDIHPQFCFKILLAELGIKRSQLHLWGEEKRPGRTAFIRHIMTAPQELNKWGRLSLEMSDKDVEGLSFFPAEDMQQEAQVIAFYLRNVAEHDGKTGALVTPDMDLARRVYAELLHLGIHADFSAGESLHTTPPAVFLRLISKVVEEDFSPVSLLSLLKHPFSSFGMGRDKVRKYTRILEKNVLRGALPPAGIDGLRRALMHHKEDFKFINKTLEGDVFSDLLDFLDHIQKGFSFLLDLSEKSHTLSRVIEALIHSAHYIAATLEDKYQGERLWRGDDGEALAHHLADLISYGTTLIVRQGKNTSKEIFENFDAFLVTSMTGKTIRGLRGYSDGQELAHPRISILGVLEARLMSFDCMVLGGLVEGSWPADDDAGPWLNYDMREKLGLPSLGKKIGISAYDFSANLLNASDVLMTSSARCDDTPTVRSRWLVKMEAFLRNYKGDNNFFKQSPQPYLWFKKIEELKLSSKRRIFITPPKPCPPVALRPKALSITAIDSLKRDPYSIYAHYILGLKKLNDLAESPDYREYGDVVHKGLEYMLDRNPSIWPKNGAKMLMTIFNDVLEEFVIEKPFQAWWKPELYKIAEWVSEQEEKDNQERITYTEIEVSKEYKICLCEKRNMYFGIRGKADRIDLYQQNNGSMKGTIFDYKTGSLPTNKNIIGGWETQLILEAFLLEEGAFMDKDGKSIKADVENIFYWNISGRGKDACSDRNILPILLDKNKDQTLKDYLTDFLKRLKKFLLSYLEPQSCYLAVPRLDYTLNYNDYEQLERIDEWQNNEEKGEML